jgi:O-acetyl-ADP-ribose deacetylase (regulator of RNase III)
MGTFNLIRGDLFETARPIIAHSVNCRGGFGSGVAGQIAKIYPKVRREYLAKYAKLGWSLGECQIVWINRFREVANLAIQEEYGHDGRLYADYEAIRLAFCLLMEHAAYWGRGVALPKIGCGLAGGDWAAVEPILREAHAVHARNIDVDIYYL